MFSCLFFGGTVVKRTGMSVAWNVFITYMFYFHTTDFQKIQFTAHFISENKAYHLQYLLFVLQ